ncbi:hypothetical protein ROZALSC1DRAFT_29705 [Rozella allomycis CSF55]|uniref:Metallo-beta-lactamase domain-containing protein n=1 Tax=Rozella allomycis (strain CSF55) TaxID=988480 RepID=A0A4P9YGJ7_ROZAC|nr:hypothetical protein ROZALSC1DRAFT_29705 [Rozella allomycis CSF55]
MDSEIPPGFKGSKAHHHPKGYFINPWPSFKNVASFWSGFKLLRQMDFKRSKPPPEHECEAKVCPVNFEILKKKIDNDNEARLTWLGHASFLLQIKEANILFDPIFSDRCSLSHYDHMDLNTLKALRPDTTYFVPLGNKSWIINNVSKQAIVNEYTGYRSVPKDIPDNFDVNKLDYCPVFKEIGKQIGPFDLACIPIGAYSPRWFMSPVHCAPEDSVCLHQDIKSKKSIGMHYGTFVLTDEPVEEPPVRLKSSMVEKGLDPKEFECIKIVTDSQAKEISDPRMQYWLFPIFAILGISLYLYSDGFLLSRTVLTNTNDKVIENPKSFKKLVFVVIDALRFDFMDPEAKQYPFNGLWDIEENDILFEMIADPPTTTAQRLKGMLTGGLPTFIDASSNFESSMLDEDNWLYQLSLKKNSIYFFGDETWVKLFPHILNNSSRVFPFESFKLFDLHTVDNGINNLIFPVLESNNYDVIVAHYLGIDHCGHKYGPLHPSMVSKIQEMNNVIKKIKSYIDNDTLLVVAGDHGMTLNGDHGADSHDEISTAALFYSPAFKRKVLNYNDNRRSFPQVYLPPTISYLMNIPIPYSNLGIIIDSFLSYTCDNVSDCIMNKCIENLNQMKNYVKQYPSDEINYLAEFPEPKDFSQCKERGEFILKEMGTALTTFDDISIVMGIILMIFCTTVLLIIYIFQFEQNIFKWTWVLSLGASGIFFASIFKDYQKIVLFWIGISLALLYLAGFRGFKVDVKSADGVFAVGLLLVQSLGFLSNSFIIFEDRSILYFFQSSIAFLYFKCCDNINTMKKLFFISIVVRLASLFGACREEQYPYCNYLTNANISSIYLLAAFLTFAISQIYLSKNRTKSLFTAFAVGLLCVIMIQTSLHSDVHSFQEQDNTFFNGTFTEHNVASTDSLSSYKIDETIWRVWLPRCYLLTLSLYLAFSKDWTTFWIYLLSLLQRPVGSMMVLGLSHLLHTILPRDRKFSEVHAILFSHFGFILFLSTGHQTVLASIQWESAFIGMSSYNYYLAGLMVLLNTYAGHIISLILFISRRPDKKLLSFYCFAQLLPFLFMSLTNYFLKRHLMIWKIFVPRWMFQFCLLSLTFLMTAINRK